LTYTTDPELAARLDGMDRSLERLQATIQQMNKHLGLVTIKANEGSRLSSEVAKAFEFALIDSQELRRDLNSLKGSTEIES
jgi:hypothetical protein